ncbi:hypothetical protein LOK49_LG12G02244 [Camellia lanceoleosa]|uniref:Uncharacterized protein n=1 Tax=Camellia lanceoleosa TaxID=1840588 RepID=A0ACC0FUR1_9ERIC|nr:hypothetical protein LOK49_LG12G02244 [Camellia lanceoleosa]
MAAGPTIWVLNVCLSDNSPITTESTITEKPKITFQLLKVALKAMMVPADSLLFAKIPISSREDEEEEEEEDEVVGEQLVKTTKVDQEETLTVAIVDAPQTEIATIQPKIILLQIEIAQTETTPFVVKKSTSASAEVTDEAIPSIPVVSIPSEGEQTPTAEQVANQTVKMD